MQFGEGNFLRAFADWIVEAMNKKGDFNAGIAVVQPIPKGLVPRLKKQDGLYTLILKGIRDNKPVRDKMVVACVQEAIDPYEHYGAFIATAKMPDIRFMISNTTEAGISVDDKDQLEDRPQKSFPGKLTAWLYTRYRHFRGEKDKGIVFLPCELIDKNGQKLKEAILEFVRLWQLEEEFSQWVEEGNIFCNTLVDRIVPGFPRDNFEEITEELGYRDHLVVEGEQFHLWVIEGPEQVSQEFPANEAGLNVIFADDLVPYRSRKVHILNGAHTLMVPVGLLYGLEAVRETVEHPVLGSMVKKAIYHEIIPTLSLPLPELETFAASVLERFRNPFIHHQLISIALNSISKFTTRVLPSLLKYTTQTGQLPDCMVFSLATLLWFYRDKDRSLNDDPEILDFFQYAWKDFTGAEREIEALVPKVLENEALWGQNLKNIEGLTSKIASHIKIIHTHGAKEAIDLFAHEMSLIKNE